MKNINQLNRLFRSCTDSSIKFNQKIKINKFTNERLLEKKNWPKSWREIYYKSYFRLKEIILPKPTLKKISLEEALKFRQSKRRFTNRVIGLKKISTILYFSAGLMNHSRRKWRRFYPSAGARYPLELYLISINTKLPTGIYHYYVKNHSLEQLMTVKKFNFKKYFYQGWIEKAGFLILISTVFQRTLTKYGDRGYRYMLLETGHLGQNIALLASGLGIACCPIGGFIDKKIDELLDIDGINESIIYIFALG